MAQRRAVDRIGLVPAPGPALAARRKVAVACANTTCQGSSRVRHDAGHRVLDHRDPRPPGTRIVEVLPVSSAGVTLIESGQRSPVRRRVGRPTRWRSSSCRPTWPGALRESLPVRPPVTVPSLAEDDRFPRFGAAAVAAGLARGLRVPAATTASAASAPSTSTGRRRARWTQPGSGRRADDVERGVGLPHQRPRSRATRRHAREMHHVVDARRAHRAAEHGLLRHASSTRPAGAAVERAGGRRCSSTSTTSSW